MDLNAYFQSTTLMFMLLNPFLVILYILHLVQTLRFADFSRVMIRAGWITTAVFCVFAVLGDAVFTRVFQADFASFQIFGGVTFLLIGLQFVFRGPDALEILRGDMDNLAGAVAMPVLIGPGTISASVVVGERHPPVGACVVLLLAVMVSVLFMILLKWVHDTVRPRKETLIQRYIEIAGRITALFVGTISIQMIMQGLRTWMEKF